MLKKIILILLTAAILNGCRSSKEINNVSSKVDSATDINNSAYVEVTTFEITESKTDNTPSETYAVPSNTESSEASSKNENKPSEVKNSKVSETSISSETATSSEASTASDIVESDSPSEEISTDDSVWISNRVFEILNSEREAIGKHKRATLPGLTKIAVFRAEQLVTQFSHSWIDENGKKWDGAQYAATVFKYGKYFDWAQAGCPELVSQNYYSYGGGENIYSGGFAVRPKEEIARSIVNRFKESTEHWNSLMNDMYNYDGVGVVFNDNKVYCSVNSSIENYG